MAAQVVHAAGESASAWTRQTGNALPEGTYAVVLEVDDEAALLEVEAHLSARGASFVAVREPDAPHSGALMAIGLFPSPRKVLQKHVGGVLRRLPLLGTAAARNETGDEVRP